MAVEAEEDILAVEEAGTLLAAFTAALLDILLAVALLDILLARVRHLLVVFRACTAPLSARPDMYHTHIPDLAAG